MNFDLDALCGRIAAPDADAVAAARARQYRLTKPAGALGRLEDVSVWLAGVQGHCPPSSPMRPRVVVFAADHGVAAAGVSAYPAEVTGQMVANIARGGAAVNVLADQVGATVRVVDVGVLHAAEGVPASVREFHVRPGSGRIDREPALTRAEVERAFEVGHFVADAEVDAGADLLIPGDMGIGNTTPATAVVAALTQLPVAALVGRGTGIDDDTLQHKIRVIEAALTRAPDPSHPLGVVAVVGGTDIAATVGFLLAAAARRTPVVLDGIVSCAAALVAARLAPGAVDWWIAGHRSTEPAQQVALDALELAPLLDLNLRLGEGTGALLCVPLLRAAAATLAEMATFDEAGVSDRDA